MTELEPTIDTRELDLDALARWLAGRGLAVPAMFFLELHRPLAHLSSQALLVGFPLLAPLLGRRRFDQLCAVLADDGQYRAFLDRIEQTAKASEG